MDDRTLWLRTGYLLDFTVKNGRKQRRELVSELVPVKIQSVPDAEPALVYWLGGEPVRVVLYLHDGELYESVLHKEEMTVAAFERAMRDKDRELGADRVLWHRDDLARRGIDRFNVLSAPLRESLNIKDIYADERADGLVRAHAIAEKLLICGDLVLKKATQIPCQEISVSGYNMDVSDRWAIEPGLVGGGAQVSRCFRSDDADGVDAFVERLRERFTIVGELGNERFDQYNRPYDYEWTAAGRSVEDTTAWWLIATAQAVARDPLGDDPAWLVMDADTAFVAELLGLRDDVAAYRDFVPVGEEASIAASRVIARFETIRELIGDDARPPYERLADGLDWVLEEVRLVPPRPVTEAHNTDEASLGAF